MNTLAPMRIFHTYAELCTALDIDDTSDPRAFRFLPQFAPAGFICCSCRQCVPFSFAGGGTGYGCNEQHEMHCYECCARHMREYMIENGRADLYLCEHTGGQLSEHSNRDRARVTDWPGKLVFPVLRIQRRPHSGGFGAQRTDAWFKGPDGFVWHAINRGNSQVARCKRTALRA